MYVCTIRTAEHYIYIVYLWQNVCSTSFSPSLPSSWVICISYEPHKTSNPHKIIGVIKIPSVHIFPHFNVYFSCKTEMKHDFFPNGENHNDMVEFAPFIYHF